jgi:phosphoglycerate dehydrogenase-like enzyme
MKLLIYPGVEPARLERIVGAATGFQVVNAANERDATKEIIDADAVFGTLTPALLARAKKLRWIQAPTVSMENFLFPELVEHPCVVTGMRGLFSDVIAEQVFGYILCFSRNLHIYIRNQLKSRWTPVGGEEHRQGFTVGGGLQTPIDLAHAHLAGQTLGIVGLGNIGREIARRGLAFGMRIVATDPMPRYVPEGVEAVWGPERLDRLLNESDFVVVAAPHTPETVKLFRRPQFLAMKRSAYFINIGRGVLVSLDDLCDALAAGEIAGAGLDVYETEPLPKEHRLWKFENVILTPHIAGHAPRIAERHLAVLVDNIHRFAHGEPLVNVVDKRVWY